jgi:hypothetical protein
MLRGKTGGVVRGEGKMGREREDGEGKGMEKGKGMENGNGNKISNNSLFYFTPCMSQISYLPCKRHGDVYVG